MKYFRENSTIRKQRKILKDKLKFPYVLKVTTTRMYLDSEIGSYMTSEGKMPMREVGYIDKIKEDIIKNEMHFSVPRVKEENINYFKYSSEVSKGVEINNCHEVDLKSAYWEMANVVGILSEQYYKLASSINPKTGEVYISKKVRLAAIGALARRRRIYSFDGKKEIMTHDESPETEHVWDYICYQIGKIMEEARKEVGKDFVFYWVDAIIVKSEAAKNKVLAVFKKHAYDATEILIDSIKLNNQENKVWVTTNKKDLHKKDGRKIRRFPHASDKKKGGRHAEFFRMRDGK